MDVESRLDNLKIVHNVLRVYLLERRNCGKLVSEFSMISIGLDIPTFSRVIIRLEIHNRSEGSKTCSIGTTLNLRYEEAR